MRPAYVLSVIQLPDFYSLLSCLVHVHGVSGYEWGHNATSLQDIVSYRDVIIVPDPELLAPSDGVMNHLDFYSANSGSKFRMVILGSLGATANNNTPMYIVQGVTSDLVTSHQGTQRIELRSNDLYVNKNDVISFWIFDEMPIPYKTKSSCSSSQKLLVSRRNAATLRRNDILEFEGVVPEQCLMFSYQITVLSLDVHVTADAPLPLVITEKYANSNGSVNDVNDEEAKAANPCTANCDIATVKEEHISDMYRYVIFGPLIVLWIIVSAVCSIKMKRTLPCCRKPGGSSVRPSHAEAERAPPRRGRFGRVTLSRVPPPGVTIVSSQPKPLMDAVPGIVLPPYPGFQDSLSDEQSTDVMSSGYPPAYPPPAYSIRDDKQEQTSTAFDRLTAMPAVEEVNGLSGSATDEGMTSGSRLQVTPAVGFTAPSDQSLGAVNGGYHIDDVVHRRAHGLAYSTPPRPELAWNACYNAYPGPPPSYEEATETHM